jgi:hypothetical protein
VTSVKYKIFVLIPDGVSLRNFAYTNFCKLAESKGFDVVFWHHTPFNLENLGFKELKLNAPKLHWLNTILKNSKKRIEINRFAKRENDTIFYEYLFPQSYKGMKNLVRNVLTDIVAFIFSSERGLRFIRLTINRLEQHTKYFKSCKKILIQYQPDFILCASQRSMLAIAPIQAANNLNIPTMSFVFSWDNLPKATLDVTANYYAVWSEHMKQELLHYYHFVSDKQVKVTGTPQFECHYNKELLISKSKFYEIHNLEKNRTYLCFSGDDVTTSPKDELYLRDVAEALKKLNKRGYHLGLIFRRCPVDFSERYEKVLDTYSDLIVSIDPKWEKMGGAWDTILPHKEDLPLLANLAEHTVAVINLGSSMVFDYVAHKKPSFYMNYNYLNPNNTLKKGVYVYDYVHFRSKPNKDVVTWLNHPNDIADVIHETLNNNQKIVDTASKWYEKINQKPPEKASVRILDQIIEILNKNKD